MLIKLGNHYVEPSTVAVVRAASDKKKTIVFTTGQSSVDGGHLIDLPLEAVLEKLADCHRQEAAWHLAQLDNPDQLPEDDHDRAE